MKIKNVLSGIIVGIVLLSNALLSLGQTVLYRYDWDANTTLGAPTYTVTASSFSPLPGGNPYLAGGTMGGIGEGYGVMAGTPAPNWMSSTPNPATAIAPAAATFGSDSSTLAGGGTLATSNGFWVLGGWDTTPAPAAAADSTRTVEVEFPQIIPRQSCNGTLHVTFRATGINTNSGGPSAGVDSPDRITLLVSSNGGTTYTAEASARGNANSTWTYGTGVSGTDVFNGTDTGTGSANKIDMSMSCANYVANPSLKIKLRLSASRTDELIALDDVVVYCDPTPGLCVPTAGDGSIRGRVTNEFGRGVSRASVSALDTNTGETFYGRTNQFGYYTINDLQIGNFFIVQAMSKRYQFPFTQSFTLDDNFDGINFVAASSMNATATTEQKRK